MNSNGVDYYLKPTEKFLMKIILIGKINISLMGSICLLCTEKTGKYSVLLINNLSNKY